MDYKYIEQLLERYWNAETTLEEEHILRTFFRQSDVPAHLNRYAALFAQLDAEVAHELDSRFDERVLRRIADDERTVVRAERPTLLNVIRPLMQAAAAVVVVVLTAYGAQRAFERADRGVWDYNPASFENSYDNPQQAYKVLQEGLDIFSRTAQADTARAAVNPETEP